jgi:alpha-1,3-glucosyltransferase
VALSAFVFGWHSHEKAILVALIPLGLVAPLGADEARLYLRLSGLGIFALFPLFTHPRETPTKVLLYLSFMRLAWNLLADQTPTEGDQPKRGSLSGKHRISPRTVDWCFMGALLAVFAFSEVVHPIAFRGQFEFLPLMLTSVVCAAGVVLCWGTSAASLTRDVYSLVRGQRYYGTGQ